MMNHSELCPSVTQKWGYGLCAPAGKNTVEFQPPAASVKINQYKEKKSKKRTFTED